MLRYVKGLEHEGYMRSCGRGQLCRELLALLDCILRAVLTLPGVQRPKSTDGRIGSTEGNPPRLGRRHTLYGNPRNLIDEGAEAREHCQPTRCHSHREQAHAGLRIHG